MASTQEMIAVKTGTPLYIFLDASTQHLKLYNDPCIFEKIDNMESKEEKRQKLKKMVEIRPENIPAPEIQKEYTHPSNIPMYIYVGNIREKKCTPTSNISGYISLGRRIINLERTLAEKRADDKINKLQKYTMYGIALAIIIILIAFYIMFSAGGSV